MAMTNCQFTNHHILFAYVFCNVWIKYNLLDIGSGVSKTCFQSLSIGHYLLQKHLLFRRIRCKDLYELGLFLVGAHQNKLNGTAGANSTTCCFENSALAGNAGLSEGHS